MSKVFIGSTSFDLKPYRQAAINVCNRLGLVPIVMEFFTAIGAGATEGSKRKVDVADLYVGIFAHRYGYIEDGFDQSVTEIEFHHAGTRGLDRLCFLVDPNYMWPPEYIDHENYPKLQAFKKNLNSSLIRAQFTDVNDFTASLMQALIEWREQHIDATSDQKVISLKPTIAPPVPSLVIGRDADKDTLKTRMGLNDPSKTVARTVIHGWPGVGKTTLITSLAADETVQRYFTDGVLWVSLGENPSPVEQLLNWGRALGNLMVGINTLSDAISIVRALLKDRHVLLIVDDVWEADAALPFLVGGIRCVTVITTRDLGIARQLATVPDEIYHLDTLNDDQGYKMLATIAPTVTQKYPARSRQLVNNMEGLPLAIHVAGRLLEAEIRDGFDVEELFQEFEESHRLLDEVAPHNRFNPIAGTTPTIRLLFKKSTDRLDDETRKHFAFMGAFAPKPATFDLAALKSLWNVDQPKAILRHLLDRGLLEFLPAVNRFWLHALLVKHAAEILDSLDD